MTGQFQPARPRPAASRARRDKRPTAYPHELQPDPALGTTYDGRVICGACGKPGRVGDAQHPVGVLPTLPPLPADVLDEQARRLGERPDTD